MEIDGVRKTIKNRKVEAKKSNKHYSYVNHKGKKLTKNNKRKTFKQDLQRDKSLMSLGLHTSQAFFFKRFKAFAIDLFMIYTPILYVMTYIILGNKEAFQENQWAIFICVLLYGIIDSLFCCVASQTLGMRAQGLVLKDSRGKNVLFFTALFRFFVWLFSLGLIFGFIFPFLRKDHKTFHDFICCTVIKIQTN